MCIRLVQPNRDRRLSSTFGVSCCWRGCVFLCQQLIVLFVAMFVTNMATSVLSLEQQQATTIGWQNANATLNENNFDRRLGINLIQDVSEWPFTRASSSGSSSKIRKLDNQGFSIQVYQISDRPVTNSDQQVDIERVSSFAVGDNSNQRTNRTTNQRQTADKKRQDRLISQINELTTNQSSSEAPFHRNTSSLQISSTQEQTTTKQPPPINSKPQQTSLVQLNTSENGDSIQRRQEKQQQQQPPPNNRSASTSNKYSRSIGKPRRKNEDEEQNSVVYNLAESEKIEQNSDCALILKRTYILKKNDNNENESGSNNNDEWGDKFVFNDSDDDVDEKKKHKKHKKKDKQKKPKKHVHESDLCIKHSDVDKAIEEAKHQIKFELPNDLDSPEISGPSIAAVGELNLAASLLLRKKFDLSHDEILNALPMIDMSSSRFFWKDLCPKHVRPMICSKSRYRTMSGHCNNLRHPSWGAAKTPYSRYLPPDYADGVGLPRASRHSGKPLPSARLISSVVHVDSDEPSHDYSVLFADWGQLLNHDITRVAVGEAPDCCPQYLKGLCMPIPVPQDDPLYSEFEVKCLKFDRALAAVRPKCLLGSRAQINLITSPVDASFVYGSSKEQANSLRTFSNGKMKVWNYFETTTARLKPLLPPKTEQPDQDCLARPKKLFCFVAGDVRVNEQTHLTVLHTVYVREHNRIAKQLGQINPDWDDDKIYHETRHIVAACVQHVMANEFLPLLLGPKLIAEYRLKPAPDWNDGYDPSVTISTGTAFAAAAFRYGHSMIEGVIRRLDPQSGSLVRAELLRHLFKRPFLLYEPGAIDQLIMGMLLTPAEQTDPFVSEELSGHLFQPPKAKFGHDLAAINIQRGRDKGVPGYNDWREWCGLKRASSFGDLEPLLMNRTAWQYSRIYKHVDDIDLWSAGISERKLPGSAVGPTMACIIARQFLNFKRGDRFWYENPNQPSSFTKKQLLEIKKMSLAKILCTNADDLPIIQPWAMRLPHPIYNARVDCESLPTMNLKYWDSSNMESFD